MGHDDDAPEAEAEFLDVGPRRMPTDSGRAVRRSPRWLPLLLVAGIIAALVIVIIVRQHRAPSASPTTHPAAPSRSVTSAPNPAPSSPGSPLATVTVTEVGHRLLGVTAGWELFGRGDGVLIRIQLARGRITRTTVPGLASSGPVSFIVGANLAIIRPIDYVPGYVVTDGKPARQISANLGQGKSGPVFPGPDPNHIWVPNLGGVTGMTLAPLNSAGPGATRLLPIPPDSSLLAAIPDGAGYLLYPTVGGVYDSRPGGLHRITGGSLLAVGPSGSLTLECDPHDHCVTVYIDRASNTRSVVGHGLTGSGQPGVISPDGATAALFQHGPTCTPLCLFDLATGTTHPIALPLDQAAYDRTVVWSPDSRWLFVLGSGGKLYALDAHTRRTTPLLPARIRLPQLSQLAIRD